MDCLWSYFGQSTIVIIIIINNNNKRLVLILPPPQKLSRTRKAQSQAQKSYQRSNSTVENTRGGQVLRTRTLGVQSEARASSWSRQRFAHLPGSPRTRKKLCSSSSLNIEPMNKGSHKTKKKTTQAYQIKSLGGHRVGEVLLFWRY